MRAVHAFSLALWFVAGPEKEDSSAGPVPSRSSLPFPVLPSLFLLSLLLFLSSPEKGGEFSCADGPGLVSPIQKLWAQRLRLFLLPWLLPEQTQKNKKAREDHRLCHSPSSPAKRPMTPHTTSCPFSQRELLLTPSRPQTSSAGQVPLTLLSPFLTLASGTHQPTCLCSPLSQGSGADPNFKRKRGKTNKLETSGVGAFVFIL